MAKDIDLSLIIPVYNSAKIVAQTVAEVVRVGEAEQWNYELLLVNDGSTDNSWDVISWLARTHPNVKAINLLKNYGQHTAVYCGIKLSKGHILVTLDDDLQNPPAEVPKLISKLNEGHDAVIGQFPVKMHGIFRKWGSQLIGYLNGLLFHKPKGLVLSNFRAFTRDVADRMVSVRTVYPYIPGLVLMSGSNFANVETQHMPRAAGTSNYTFFRIISLVGRLVFSYSTLPLKWMAAVGLVASLAAFGIGIAVFLKYLIVGTPVPGWTSVMVLTSFLSGVIITMLGTIGIYLVKLYQLNALQAAFHIEEIVT